MSYALRFTNRFKSKVLKISLGWKKFIIFRILSRLKLTKVRQIVGSNLKVKIWDKKIIRCKIAFKILRKTTLKHSKELKKLKEEKMNHKSMSKIKIR